jgi:HD-GYP domain-containing protein (c-di-GMP phosphodiesterase class II)
MAVREMEAHAGTQFDPNMVAAIRGQIKEQDTFEKKPGPPPSKGE